MRAPQAVVLLVLLSCLALWSHSAAGSRVAPDDSLLLSTDTTTSPASHASTTPPPVPQDSSLHKKHKKHKNSSSIDYQDQDPDVRSHWALLAAGSSGWFNYRHQADVYHAYQVLLAGGYRRDHIIVMAADDIAQDSENPMPGKVFNAPGGPDVYEGVRIDYRGPDVTAENFLSVLLGDAAAMAGKGSGRVVDSGPHDKVFVFYSDHGAAGVLGMPNGPFLYADEFIKTLKKKHARKGFKEAVLYIEACESGSMFEGLLGNDLDIYVTTAANAIESSWATYCPTFFSSSDGSTSSSSNDGSSSSVVAERAAAAAASAVVPAAADVDSSSGWRRVAGALASGLSWLQQQLGHITGAPHHHHNNTHSTIPKSSAAGIGVGDGVGDGVAKPPGSPIPPPAPRPEFTTCLGDLYSVSWMEDAEVADLTDETLLQQYKKIKVRTSQNFTYDQGSHVMQYGDLDIDREAAGDYEGMKHNGSSPTPTVWPSADWTQLDAEAVAEAAAAATGGRGQGVLRGSVSGLQALQQRYSSPAAFLQSLKSEGHSSHSSHSSSSSSHHKSHFRQQQQFRVEQRDADLVPLAAAAAHSACPRRRAAAAAALSKVTAARLALEAAARSATAALISHPEVGPVMLTQLRSTAAVPQHMQQHLLIAEQQHTQPSLLVGSDSDSSVAGVVEALMGPLPSAGGGVGGSSSSSSGGGGALVGDWQCLRGMVQAWEGGCGRLDQYGMKLTRLFANLCNAGVAPHQLTGVLSTGTHCGGGGGR